MISIQTLSQVVHQLPVPAVLTDADGFVVVANTQATSALHVSETAQDVHLDRHLATLSTRPSTQISSIASDEGEHQLVLLGDAASQSTTPADVTALAGAIAHDFNNLLGVIINYTTLAAADAPEGSQQSRDLAEVLSASRRAAEITDRLRRMSATRTTA